MTSSAFTLGFCYGTAALWQGKKAEQERSHRWTVYVRGANNEDLSPVVKRVLFQLHDRQRTSLPSEFTTCLRLLIHAQPLLPSFLVPTSN